MHGKDFNRAERVGDQIQRELADIITRAVDDPRVAGVTLSGVDVSPDLRNARVYVTVPLGSDPGTVVGALQRAGGFLRGRLARRVRMRRIPALSFVHDETLEKATRVGLLIDSVSVPESDRGEPDPAGDDDGP